METAIRKKRYTVTNNLKIINRSSSSLKTKIGNNFLPLGNVWRIRETLSKQQKIYINQMGVLSDTNEINRETIKEFSTKENFIEFRSQIWKMPVNYKTTVNWLAVKKRRTTVLRTE